MVVTSPVRVTRVFEFPRVIVWDALLDEDLVAGWLGEAQIEGELGGRYDLTWLHLAGSAVTPGHITELVPLERLDLETRDAGSLGFTLEELEGGSRGTSTRLSLIVAADVEAAFLGRVKADWLVRLDQLNELLRGHPVDWAHWDRDWLDVWNGYLLGARGSTA